LLFGKFKIHLSCNKHIGIPLINQKTGHVLRYCDVDSVHCAIIFTVLTGGAFTRISNQRHVIKPLEYPVDTGSKTLFAASTQVIIDLYSDIHRTTCL